MLDLTLTPSSNNLGIYIPDFSDYVPPHNVEFFGKKVTRGVDPLTGLNNLGGLNVQQVNDNIIAPFVKMRPFVVNANADTNSTSEIQFDAKIVFYMPEYEESITLSLGNASYEGCIVTIMNSTTLTQTISYNEVGSNVARTATVLPLSLFKIMWNGTTWVNITAPSVGETAVQYPTEKEPSVIYPCTTWEEITKYNGAFFRAEGGKAAAFIEEGQELGNPQAQGTAKNGLSFTGTRKKTGTQSSNPTFSASGSHGHTFSSPNPSSFDDPYGGGDDWVQKGGLEPRLDNDHGTKTYWLSHEGPIPYGVGHIPSADYSGTVSGTHKHSFTPKGSIQSSDTETRPVNYTVKMWKRTA